MSWLSELRLLTLTHTIRGRSPALVQTGFYFHRHVACLSNETLCVPDVNNRCLRVVSRHGEPVRMLGIGCVARGPTSDGRHVYAIEANGGRLHALSPFLFFLGQQLLTAVGHVLVNYKGLIRRQFFLHQFMQRILA